MILKASNHLLGIVDEVLDISRVEEGTLSISAEAIAVQRLIDDAVDLTRPLAESMEVVIHDPQLSGGNGYVFADNQRLKQVLINLIANAIKYNRRGGEVRVAVESATAFGSASPTRGRVSTRLRSGSCSSRSSVWTLPCRGSTEQASVSRCRAA